MQFFERHEGGERAVLLHVVSRRPAERKISMNFVI